MIAGDKQKLLTPTPPAREDADAESLGMKNRFRSSKICIPVRMVQAVADVVTVSLTIEEMERSREIAGVQTLKTQ